MHMTTRTNVRVGDRMHLPYRIEWAVGEPNEWRAFCKKYMKQDCRLQEIIVRETKCDSDTQVTIKFLVRFADGYEREVTPTALLAWDARPATGKLLQRGS